MAVILSRIYNIPGVYSEDEKAMYQDIIDAVRLRIADDEPLRNILNKQQEKVTDGEIISLANEVGRDLNSGTPRTKYPLKQFYNMDSNVIIMGIMVFWFIKEGLLQTANQTDFNDSGLTIQMFNKTPLYQSWYQTLINPYLQAKQDIKDSIIPSSLNSGFVGIHSEFGKYWY